VNASTMQAHLDQASAAVRDYFKSAPNELLIEAMIDFRRDPYRAARKLVVDDNGCRLVAICIMHEICMHLQSELENGTLTRPGT
jgi:hypothetical protein